MTTTIPPEIVTRDLENANVALNMKNRIVYRVLTDTMDIQIAVHATVILMVPKDITANRFRARVHVNRTLLETIVTSVQRVITIFPNVRHVLVTAPAPKMMFAITKPASAPVIVNSMENSARDVKTDILTIQSVHVSTNCHENAMQKI